MFDLVVMNHLEDATMFRVKELDGFKVGLINAEIEDKHPNQAIQYTDKSLCMMPSMYQLNKFF